MYREHIKELFGADLPQSFRLHLVVLTTALLSPIANDVRVAVSGRYRA